MMVNQKRYWLLVALLVLALAALACRFGSSPATSEPPPTIAAPTEEPTIPVTPEETSPATEEIEPTAAPEEAEEEPTPIPGEDLAKCTLQLDTTELYTNEPFVVYFTAPDTFPSDAWVGIIPSEVPHGTEVKNDQHDVAYEYLQQHADGELAFTAPDQPGEYDLRMHNTDKDDGVEVASVSFVVLEVPGADESEATLRLVRTQFQPGEEIRVRFTAPGTYPDDAWVGIIHSEVPHGDEATNDEYDLEYAYLSGQTSGVLIFQAPDEPGSYDFRMHDTDTDGLEVASVTFIVAGQAETEPEAESEETGASTYNTVFPLPDDVQQFIDLDGSGTKITFQTTMSLEETVEFYRQALSDMGLTERPILTVIEEGTFSMVFDGWEDGRSVVVQGVDFGEMFNVSIRLEEV